MNEEEGEVVRRIFRLYAEGWSMFRIAKTLNVESIPSKTGVDWSVTVIRLMLSNESYIGVDYYGRKKTVRIGRGKGKQVRTPREEWVRMTGYTPPLIEEPLFWKVQERRNESQERYQGRTYRRYLMTGFVRCGWCGAAVVGAGYVGKYWYYRCRSRTSEAVLGTKGCVLSNTINGAWMEDLVWSHVVSMVRDPSSAIADLELNFRTGGGDIGEETERLRKEVERVEQEEKRMLRLYRRGKVDVDLFEADIEELSESLSGLRERLSALEEQQVQEESVASAGERIREYCRQVSAGLEELDADGKRALMSRMGVKVLAVKGDVMITAELDPSFVANGVTSVEGRRTCWSGGSRAQLHREFRDRSSRQSCRTSSSSKLPSVFRRRRRTLRSMREVPDLSIRWACASTTLSLIYDAVRAVGNAPPTPARLPACSVSGWYPKGASAGRIPAVSSLQAPLERPSPRG